MPQLGLDPLAFGDVRPGTDSLLRLAFLIVNDLEAILDCFEDIILIHATSVVDPPLPQEKGCTYERDSQTIAEYLCSQHISRGAVLDGCVGGTLGSESR